MRDVIEINGEEYVPKRYVDKFVIAACDVLASSTQLLGPFHLMNELYLDDLRAALYYVNGTPGSRTTTNPNPSAASTAISRTDSGSADRT
jgi:hypothetical protein